MRDRVWLVVIPDGGGGKEKVTYRSSGWLPEGISSARIHRVYGFGVSWGGDRSDRHRGAAAGTLEGWGQQHPEQKENLFTEDRADGSVNPGGLGAEILRQPGTEGRHELLAQRKRLGGEEKR